MSLHRRAVGRIGQQLCGAAQIRYVIAPERQSGGGQPQGKVIGGHEEILLSEGQDSSWKDVFHSSVRLAGRAPPRAKPIPTGARRGTPQPMCDFFEKVAPEIVDFSPGVWQSNEKSIRR